MTVSDLRKRYGSIAAVDGVGFQVQTGEIFGLLGPNGAGKTTTLECLLGLRAPDSGSITIAGIDAIACPAAVKPLIGAQLQSTALQDKITPREAIGFFGSFYRNAIKPDELLRRFDLSEKANAPFDTLSTGQKQRTGLALAFVNDPRLVILDEPTAGLDPQARRQLHEVIQAMRDDGRTVILSTHYLEEAHQLCDRVAILNAGRVVASGSPAELISARENTRRILFRTDPMLPRERLAALAVVQSLESEAEDAWLISTPDVARCAAELLRATEAAGAQLLDLETRRPSLEDLFLELTHHPPAKV